jgi:hypothetical protein
MNPLGTRARSEELARLLDSGAAAAGPAASYVAVAARLRTAGADLAPAVAPRAEFRAALRTRLVAVASVQAANAQTAAAPSRSKALDSAVSWSQSRRAQRGIGVAAGAMASVVAVAGVAVAGSQSLPGDPFYGVKRGTEALELRTTDGTVAKGSKHLEFAAERLKEVRALSLGRDAALGGSPTGPVAASAFGGSTSDNVRQALADMDDETRTGSELLTSAYRSSNDEAPLQILSSFASRQSRDLQKLLPSLPTSVRNDAEQSLALVSGVAADTSKLLAVGVCTGQCNPTQAAPSLPPSSGGPKPAPAPTATTDAPCGCQPAPAPARTPDPEPTTKASPTPEPTTAPSPTATSSSPTPKPTPSSSSLPVPLPTSSVPPLPVPVPTITPSLPPVPSLLPNVADPLASALPLG